MWCIVQLLSCWFGVFFDVIHRFSTIAYLQQIWWFEVNGEVEFPFPEGTYSVFFRVQMGRTFKKFGRRLCNTEQIHGWDVKPTHFQLSTSEGQRTVSQCFLEGPGQWLHYHAGDFVVKNSRVRTQLKFSMMQIDCTHTKGGICVDSVVIYPSSFKDRLKRLWQALVYSIVVYLVVGSSIRIGYW